MIEAESIRAGRPGERIMWAWVQRANRLRPPHELADFHEAGFNAYAKQFGPDGEVLGPNPEAQAAFDQEVAIADSMQAYIKRTLIDLGLPDGRGRVERTPEDWKRWRGRARIRALSPTQRRRASTLQSAPT